MRQVAFVVDGFNLYHSTRDVFLYEHLRVKWLDIRSLCSSYMYLFGKDAILSEIYYFSAFAYHLNDPSAIKRHEDYIECLKSTGIIPEMGRFKPREATCPMLSEFSKDNPNIKCPLRGRFTRHDEKETDVAIAAKLFELLSKKTCDTAVLLTGDTDLAPAIKVCQALFDNVTILFAFPYRRHNQELENLCPYSFTIRAKQYANHLFPNTVLLPNGAAVHKPASW